MPAIRIIKMPLMIGRLQHLQTGTKFLDKQFPFLKFRLYYSMIQVQFSKLSKAQSRRAQLRN